MAATHSHASAHAPTHDFPPHSGASNAPRQPSQRIGDFEVIRTLGTGSFGKVKLAKHVITGHKVAMKFISKKKVALPEMTDRVEREIEYLGMLQHPHIIKLYDVTQTSESIVMIIEYLKGELFDYIVKTGKMAENQARSFFQQIIAAVEYCHSNDIVHRDLKPENLLLDDQLNVKIADFGLSNVMRDGDFLKTSCGSPNYAAPEVISGKLYAGPEIDIWSCGVILYVMLIGRLPFDDDHIPMLFRKINGGMFSIPPFLSNGARTLLQRMLVVDSNKRITLAEIREQDWFQVDLPEYLATPSPRIVKKTPAELAKIPMVDYRQDGTVHVRELGEVDRDIVRQVREKMPEFSEEQIIQELGNREDKRFRIAYELIADHQRARLASQAANRRAFDSPSLHRALQRISGNNESAQRPVPSNICVLPGSIPPAEMDSSVARSMQTRNPLQAGQLRQMTRPESSHSKPSAPKKAKQRWHFGIRSRSPPLEVMLEIYKTLQSLGFEWKKKEAKSEVGSAAASSNDDNGSEISKEDAKKRRRKEDEERNKQAQALYYIEARCFTAGVVVYMDIQLYQVDEHDNYLVDFRNVGYEPYFRTSSPAVGNDTAPPTSGTPPLQSAPVSHASPTAESERSSFSLPRNAAQEAIAAIKAQEGLQDFVANRTAQEEKTLRATGVSSPFLFLECACRLIIELALGSSNASSSAQ